MDANIIEELEIQPVGIGWIDMICPPEEISDFIDYCNANDNLIIGFTWWCHVSDEHEACGMGGPVSKYFNGWFSEIEIEMGNLIRLSDNESYRYFFKEVWQKDKDYQPCFWPGFWIEE